MTFVIFDLETTGFSPYSNEIIQIAAIKIRAGCLEEGTSFSTFVRPNERVPWYITNITGITQNHVQDAPSLTEALKSFSTLIRRLDRLGFFVSSLLNAAWVRKTL